MLWNFENNLLPTLNIFLSSRFPYHLTESRLFNRLRNIDWSNTQKNILWTDVLNCQHFMWKIHQGFSSRFSSHFPNGTENFPLTFRTFPLPKFIYIFVVIQILWNLFTFHGPEDETVVNQEADPPFESYHNWTTLMTRTRISARVGWSGISKISIWKKVL